MSTWIQKKAKRQAQVKRKRHVVEESEPPQPEPERRFSTVGAEHTESLQGEPFQVQIEWDINRRTIDNSSQHYLRTKLTEDLPSSIMAYTQGVVGHQKKIELTSFEDAIKMVITYSLVVSGVTLDESNDIIRGVDSIIVSMNTELFQAGLDEISKPDIRRKYVK